MVYFFFLTVHVLWIWSWDLLPVQIYITQYPVAGLGEGSKPYLLVMMVSRCNFLKLTCSTYNGIKLMISRGAFCLSPDIMSFHCPAGLLLLHYAFCKTHKYRLPFKAFVLSISSVTLLNWLILINQAWFTIPTRWEQSRGSASKRPPKFFKILSLLMWH